jgi:beta-galactosidase
MKKLSNGWEFTPVWTNGYRLGEGEGEPVRLPHNPRTIPQHYAGPEDYEGIYGYRRTLPLDASFLGKRLFLQFDGAAHIATVYVNGRELCTHRTGYTAFRVEITDAVRCDGTDLLAVRLDSTENPEIPPFGYVIDYLTYGGLYRDVWLDVRNTTCIANVFVQTPDLHTAKVQSTVSGSGASLIRSRVLNEKGEVVAQNADADSDAVVEAPEGLTVWTVTVHAPNAKPWTTETPTLYTLETTLYDADMHPLDVVTTRFGFRTAEFQKDGFYLNGKRTFLRGLDRHQAYPYMGYAAPKSLQREDARILKEELCCNAVRTSHYPQSQYFIDACDEMGILVFTEIPGWQHIGDGEWQKQAIDNVREMVVQYRNHPSIVLWGVRINESRDNDALYEKTNALAHFLDPSRQTSGVRYLVKSHLLEDVYAYNDFKPFEFEDPIRKKDKITTDPEKGYLISEHSGHMFPTKPYDPWSKRQMHALRHARTLDAAIASGEHAGCFGWCMFDYPTHKDFGSGDRVCYHGVMDAFRNPKLAAAAYASQGEETPVLVLGTPMCIGDYPAGEIGEIWAFTNAEKVALYKNDKLVKIFSPEPWNGLPHPPVKVDDLIGQLLISEEGITGKKEALLHRELLAAARYGIDKMPLADKLRMLYCMKRYKLTWADGEELYGKYVGNWGGSATEWRFDAINGERVVASVTCAPNKKLHLEVRVSDTELTEGSGYDAAAVRVRVLDGNGNLAPYAQLPIRFAVEGEIALIGPDVAAAEGGMTGTYVKTVGRGGEGTLTICSEQTAPVTVKFNIREGE